MLRASSTTSARRRWRRWSAAPGGCAGVPHHPSVLERPRRVCEEGGFPWAGRGGTGGGWDRGGRGGGRGRGAGLAAGGGGEADPGGHGVGRAAGGPGGGGRPPAGRGTPGAPGRPLLGHARRDRLVPAARMGLAAAAQA